MSGSSHSSRARLGAVGFTLIAVVLALVSTFLLARLMKGRGYDQDALVKIVVAKTKLEPGGRILASQLQMKLWPKKSVPDGSFRSMKTMLASDKKVPLHTILAGEPVLSGRLSHPKKGSGMAPLVPKDLRAFAVKIDRWVAASKMLYPGAIVDVMSTIKLKEQGFTSRLILQGVKVLAVNGAVDGVAFTRGTGKRKKKAARRSVTVATLLLTPEQSEELALATRVGKIDFVLRGASDGATVETDGVTLTRLFNLADPEDFEGVDGANGTAGTQAEGTRRKARNKRRPKARSRFNQLIRKPKRRSRKTKRGSASKAPNVVTVGGSE